MDSATERSVSRSGPWTWFGLAVAIHLLFLVAVAMANDWNLQPLIEVHDGIYYVSHLNDPLLQNVPDWWDNVPYRGIRIGFVLLALPFKIFGSVPALVIANLIGVGAGAVAIRAVARRHAASENLAWVVWVFNPGTFIATALILPDPIAWTAILLTLLAIDDRRWVLATALAVLAVLTKEASLAALGLAALMKLRKDSPGALIPVGMAAAAHIGLLAVLIANFGQPGHTGFLAWPFVGWIGAVPEWLSFRPVSGIVGIFVFASGLWVIVRWWRTESFYLSAAAGQALLMLFLSTLVVAPLAASARIGGLFWPLLAATHSKGDPARHPKEEEAALLP